MKPNVIDPILQLVPDSEFVASETGIMEWHSSETQPSQEEVDAKLKELQDDYDSKQYQRNRADTYPPIGDQLDALYHAGVFPKEMADKLKAVKEKYKKPE